MAFWSDYSKKKKGKELIKMDKKVDKIKPNGHTDYPEDEDYGNEYWETKVKELKEKNGQLVKENSHLIDEVDNLRKLQNGNVEFLQQVIMELIHKKPESVIPPKMTVADYLAKKKEEGVKKLP